MHTTLYLGLWAYQTVIGSWKRQGIKYAGARREINQRINHKHLVVSWALVGPAPAGCASVSGGSLA